MDILCILVLLLISRPQKIIEGVDKNKQQTIYNRNGKEFYLRQTEDLAWETQIQKALGLCSTRLQNMGSLSGKTVKITCYFSRIRIEFGKN